MIPKRQPSHTDAWQVRCDGCKEEAYVNPGGDTTLTRQVLTHSGWSSVQNGLKVLDFCPRCTTRRRRSEQLELPLG